jgi:DeoR/GlpR family transcriptional regulator of sugar metabolism
LSLIDFIITDEGIDEKHKQVFKDNEIELIIAEKGAKNEFKQ